MNKIERPQIDSDLLFTFATIADCGNLTAAADRLGRTQSAISVQLRKLEESLGTPLFVRSARGMALTTSGDMLLSRARPILSDIRETANLFLTPLSGVIRVGLPDDFDELVLERILEQFSKRHPGVQVVARSGCTAGYLSSLQIGELDVAVCSGLEKLGGQTLSKEPIVWTAKKGPIWTLKAPVPLAVLDRPCYWRDLPADVLAAKAQAYNVVFQSSSFTSLKAALRSGLAIGILPKSSVTDDLVVLNRKDGFPDLPTSHRSIHISEQAPKEVAEAMVDAIARAGAT